MTQNKSPIIDLPRIPVICENAAGKQHLKPQSGAYLNVCSPYDGSVIGKVGLSNASDVEQVVKLAARAFPAWQATPIKERTAVIYRFRELVLAQLDRLSHVVAAESGKTHAEARAGILKGIEVCEFATSLQNMTQGGALEVSRGVTCETRREPLGVVAGIAPFNFPAMVPMWMYPIAIVLGNCFILKASEKVPLTSVAMNDLMSQAGAPDGVFCILNGGKECVEALIDHPDVKAVGFVGSSPVAKAVYTRATSHGKRALCLGGAKNHLILTPDADPNIAIRGIVDSFTGCAGQRCMAASLMIAVGKDPAIDKMIDGIREEASRIEVGTSMGAIIDKSALERIRKSLDTAVSDGAKLVLDGRTASLANETVASKYKGGNWIGASIIDHANTSMACARDEIFGPVLTIIRVDSLSQAMEIEKLNPYGNATSVFTTSGSVARYVVERATNGMVGINIGVPVPREPFSFGGSKDSKFGPGDITGMSAVEFWTQLKKITTKWSVQPDNNWMS